MGKLLYPQTTFAGGEVSPRADARLDQQKYRSWLRQALNMVPYKTGGLTRRVGTQMIAPTKTFGGSSAQYAARTQKFVFSPSTTFTFEIGHEYIRFYSNGDQVNVASAPTWISGTAYIPGNFVTDSSNGLIYYCIASITGSTAPHSDPTHWVQQTIYEVPTPYNAYYASGTPFDTDIFGLVFDQINDVIYLTHPDYPPYSLTRFGDTDWVMQEVAFLTPALLDQNATDTIITPSALQGKGISLVASAPAWVAENYYTLADSVQVNGIIYDCVLANVSSGSFSTDLAAGYWSPIGMFNPEHVGSTWQLAVLRSSAYTQYGADAAGAQSTAAGGFSAGTSSQIQCLGSYEVHTYGVWSATIAIQRSLDGGQTWDTVSTVVGASDRNVDLTGTAVQLGIYQIVVSDVAVPINPGATPPRVIFECEDAFLYGLAQITAVTVIAASAMVNGDTYQIQALGTTNWTSLGAPANPTIGTIFTYNGTGVTGSGGQVFTPYVATANVITQLTDSNGIQPQWVSGTTYAPGAQVSYAFVSYTTAGGVTSSTPPPQDPSNWSPSQPGGTEYWSEAAWSNYRGFPQAVASFQQREIYGGSGYEPQRIWGTVTNDIENFALGDQTLATDAFAFDLNAPSRGPILWIIGQEDLFIGFSGAEWVVNSGSTNATGASSGSAITPTNITAFEQGTFGSTPEVQPQIVGNAVFFAQRQANALRQMLFSVYTEKYMSQDLSLLVDHYFAPGIVALDYQSRWRQQGIVWVVTQQGTLCGLTYDLDQEVFGWCRAQTGYGQVDPTNNPISPDNGWESLSVIPGSGTNEDELWLVSNRLIGGVQTRFIERMNPNNWEEEFAGAPNPPAPNLTDAFYVDCGITAVIAGSAIVPEPPTVGGGGGNGDLSYLNGRYVVGLANGSAFGPILVADGKISLAGIFGASVSFNVIVQVGLPISYVGQPMRIDSDQRAGNTQGLVKQLSDVFIRVINSVGGSIGNGTTQYPQWVSGQTYTVGQFVISPLTQQAFQCVVYGSGATDPSQSASWVNVTTPSYQPPVPIPYTPQGANPFAVPVLVTAPTDIRITPQLTPLVDDDAKNDPQILVVGNDALPLTVLALIFKYDLTGTP